MDAQFNRALQMLKGRKEIKAKYSRMARGKDAALWSNHEQARNLDCGEIYEALREKLLDNNGSPSNADVTGLAPGKD